MTANVLMAYPNRAGGSVSYSGPAWSTALPLANLLTRQLAQVARTRRTDAKMCWFHMAGASAFDAGVIALCRHNLTTSGKWRLRGFAADPRPTVYANFRDEVLPSGATLSRGSSATYLDAAGVLRTVGNDVARPEYDGTGKCIGILLEAPTTNQIKWSRDLTNAIWSKPGGNMGVLLTATGIDGAANSAARLTANAANARVVQSYTWGGTNPVLASVWVRRVSGSGAVRLTLDNFATMTAITLTTQYQRFYISQNSVASFGIQIDISGDVIEVDYSQVEEGFTLPSMPVLTTSAAASRAYDAIAIADTSGTLAAGALAVCGKLKAKPGSDMALAQLANVSYAAITLTTAGQLRADYYLNPTGYQAQIATSTLANGDSFSVAMSWAANDVRAAAQGAAGTPDSVATMSSAVPAGIALAANVEGMAWVVSEVRHHVAALSAAQVLSLGSTEFEISADYDSGQLDAWPASWVASTTAEKRAGVPGLAFLQPGSTQTYQYWRVDLIDEANPAGYLELGRVFMGSAWQPGVNMSYGAGLSYTPRESVAESFSGAEFFVVKPNPRVARFALDMLTVAEAFGDVLEMQRQLGTTGELLFSWDPTDLAQLPRHSFLGRLRTLSAIEMPYIHTHMQTAVEIKELL